MPFGPSGGIAIEKEKKGFMTLTPELWMLAPRHLI
jgi:hypothetical protein